jgi:hypothetical protein
MRELPETISIEKAELERLIKDIDDLQRGIDELWDHAGDVDQVEGRCAVIQLRLSRMRQFLTVLR